jgi:hypothetical protein
VTARSAPIHGDDLFIGLPGRFAEASASGKSRGQRTWSRELVEWVALQSEQIGGFGWFIHQSRQ